MILTPSLTLMYELKREDPESFYTIKLSLGTTHSAVITASGELFTAGSNIDGQLGCQLSDQNASGYGGEEQDEILSSPLNQVLPYGDENNPKAKEVF